MSVAATHNPISPWPHRMALLLVGATFPLLWIGGLVTTYRAGMAVPDWPNTYGYNLFVYPWQTWVFGPWKLFVEHGHRLLASAVGMLAIGFAVSVWLADKRSWMRYLAIAAVLLVSLQGALGGMRVLLDERTLAMLHGCTGPAFFALSVALAVFTSPRWLGTGSPRLHPRAARLQALLTLTTGLAYLQLVLGAQLRHLPVGAGPGFFRAALMFHLLVAGLLLVHVGLVAARTLCDHGREPALLRPAVGLAILIVLQLVLGCAAYVTNYGWPAWATDWGLGLGYVVSAKSAVQIHLTTAHVATGSLILATSTALMLRSFLLLRNEAAVEDLAFVAGVAG